MLRTIGRAALMTVMSSAVFGQTFEVASVKPAAPGGPNGVVHGSGPRLTAEGVTVHNLLIYAYSLKNYQLSMPAPMDTAKYDIAATAEDGSAPTGEEFRQMMQSLLADRFKLTVHRERKEMPVYALIVAKNGPKLKESAADADSSPLKAGPSGRNYQVTMPKATIANLLRALDFSGLDLPVVDKTGLTGTYDLKLNFTPERSRSRGPEPAASQVSIFTAIQEQLGLKLEPQKAMVEIVVVDHVEKPSAN